MASPADCRMLPCPLQASLEAAKGLETTAIAAVMRQRISPQACMGYAIRIAATNAKKIESGSLPMRLLQEWKPPLPARDMRQRRRMIVFAPVCGAMLHPGYRRSLGAHKSFWTGALKFAARPVGFPMQIVGDDTPLSVRPTRVSTKWRNLLPHLASSPRFFDSERYALYAFHSG